ncbi:MAG TPA: hypothetical protein EYP25_07860, partial [Anaerolineae bacterium]|nr:hypothetical protein [Anaerolineae bacterium]
MTSFPRMRRAFWLAMIMGLLIIGLGVQVFAVPGNPPLDPTAKFGAAADPQQPHASDHVLVRLIPDTVPDPDFSPIFGRWHRAPVLPGETPQQALYRLAALPEIDKVELDYLIQLAPSEANRAPDRVTDLAWGYEPNDPYFDDQWNFFHVLAPEAWKRGWTGSGVTVAVLDTGVWPGPDLTCRTFVDPVSIISGTVTTGLIAAQDDHGHGTHVTGTIAQCTDNGFRDAGLAYDATIMPVKILNDTGGGAWSDIAAGIDWARTHGADVINMSLSADCGITDYPACSVSIVDDAIDAAVSAGVLIIAAAGNESNDHLGYPANRPDVMGVGAVDMMLDPAPYTNYGSALSIVAPGGDLSQDLNGDGLPDGIEQETRHPGDADWDSWFYEGTSMAAPHVSAAAAMLMAAFPAASAGDIRDALEASAMDRGALGFDNDFGYGVLQIDDAFCQL